jgi:10-bladed beta propeller domain-containing protein
MNFRLPFFIKTSLTCFLFFHFFQVKSQNIIAYTDNRGYFNIFDNGLTTVADYQAPQSFQIGGNCVAYVDYTNSLKVYYNGEISTLYDGIPTKYQVTHNLVFFNVGGVLKVFDKGKITTLSGYASSFQVGDSLIAFVDNGTGSFKVYYNGDFQTMEDFHVTQMINGYNASNNTLGYLTYLNEFKIFWNGKGYNIFKLPNSSYKLDYQTGSNIVSFTTNGMGLNVFYKGNTYTLSNKQITNYQTGDDMVAFNDAGGFHVFYAGENYDLNGFAPDFYQVADSMLIYYMPGFFYCFNKGKKEVIENFLPTEYSIDNNTLTYVDLQGGLKAYYNSDTYQLSTFDRIIGFKLTGNAVWFSTATVYNQVFLKGKTY